jgi:hypothetical protein
MIDIDGELISLLTGVLSQFLAIGDILPVQTTGPE